MKAALTTLFAVSAATAAPAQDTSIDVAFGGENPVAVKAESATYNGGLTVLEGDVVVSQDSTTVHADRMDIYRDELESPSAVGSLRLGALRRIEGRGNFRFESPDNTITGNEGIYYADRKLFVVTGDVLLVRPDGSSVEGNRLVYNLETRAAKFGTPCETGTADAGSCGGRVRITINNQR